MCKTKMAVNATQPVRRTSSKEEEDSQRPRPKPARIARPGSAFSEPSSSSTNPLASGSGFGSGSDYGFRLGSSAATTSVSSRGSLASLRDSLPENAQIYDFSEIRAATNNFLAKRYSSKSSSQSWRTVLRGKDVIIFQRKSRKVIEESELKSKLSLLGRSHQKGIIKLLGASISRDYVYLVYEFVNGVNLSVCLRNPKNPSFTLLSTWMSRVQIATDIAHGLEYIHHNTGLNIHFVHKHVKSSGIIVTEPDFHAKICHFGAAELCGETADYGEAAETRRSGEFEGVRGYMAPEFQTSGQATQESDVYAFGVVLLELLCGEEPVRFKYDKETGNYRKISVIEAARATVNGEPEDREAGIEARLRRWIDRRLKDSFPVAVAEKLTRVALECVHVEADQRPSMRRVAGKVSKLYIDSKFWSDQVTVPTDFSISLAAR